VTPLNDGGDREQGADRVFKDPSETASGTVDNIEVEECLSEINAAFNHPTEKYAYLVSRDQYFRLEANDK
jgi:hypothetical protein